MFNRASGSFHPGLFRSGAAFFEQHEGYTSFLPGSNVSGTTSRYDDSDKFAARLSALWQPDAPYRVFASAERFADRGSGTVPVALRPAGGAPLRSALISSPGALDMKNDTFHLRGDLETRANLELSYLFGWARMTRRNVSQRACLVTPPPSRRPSGSCIRTPRTNPRWTWTASGQIHAKRPSAAQAMIAASTAIQRKIANM